MLGQFLDEKAKNEKKFVKAMIRTIDRWIHSLHGALAIAPKMQMNGRSSKLQRFRYMLFFRFFKIYEIFTALFFSFASKARSIGRARDVLSQASKARATRIRGR